MIPEAERPWLLCCRTHIGYGSPNRQDSSKAHGEPLGEDEVRLTKQKLGWPEAPTFLVPDEVRQELRKALPRGGAWEAEWRRRFAAYAAAFPAEADRWEQYQAGRLPAGWDALPEFAPGEKLATRQASGAVLNAIADKLPLFLGGSADLGPSNNTTIKDEQSFSGCIAGRNIQP